MLEGIMDHHQTTYVNDFLQNRKCPELKETEKTSTQEFYKGTKHRAKLFFTEQSP